MVLRKTNGVECRPIPVEGFGSSEYVLIERVLENPDELARLVTSDPNKAIRLYHIREDRRLGEAICQLLSKNAEYLPSVADIRRSMNQAD